MTVPNIFSLVSVNKGLFFFTVRMVRLPKDLQQFSALFKIIELPESTRSMFCSKLFHGHCSIGQNERKRLGTKSACTMSNFRQCMKVWTSVFLLYSLPEIYHIRIDSAHDLLHGISVMYTSGCRRPLALHWCFSLTVRKVLCDGLFELEWNTNELSVWKLESIEKIETGIISWHRFIAADRVTCFIMQLRVLVFTYAEQLLVIGFGYGAANLRWRIVWKVKKTSVLSIKGRHEDYN